MRTVYRVLVATAALLLAGGAAMTAPKDQLVRRTLLVSKAPGPVTIDGNLAKWGNLPASEAEAQNEEKAAPVAAGVIRVDDQEQNYQGRAWLRWTDEYLYAAFRVWDDSPMKNAGDDPFLAFKTGDTIELYLCVDPNADPARAEPCRGDYHISMTLLKNEKPVVFFYRPNAGGTPKYFNHPSGGWQTRMDDSGAIPGAQFAVLRNPAGGGYTAEARIPWKFFAAFTPRPGMKLPFNWALNFSDASGQKNVMKLWWNGPNTMCSDVPTELRLNTDTWGWATLGEK